MLPDPSTRAQSLSSRCWICQLILPGVSGLTANQKVSETPTVKYAGFEIVKHSEASQYIQRTIHYST